MYNNDLIAWCQEAAKYPRLSKEEEKDLLEKAHKGDKDAREKLITHNLKLVISIAQDFTGPGIDVMDLIQQGNIGLIYSIDHYDPSRETALSTAATYGIRKFIFKYYFEQSRLVRKPQWQQEMTNKMRDAEKELKATLGRAPEIKEIAEYIGIPEITVEQILKDNSVKYIPLQTPLNDDGDTVEEIIAAPENKEAIQERYRKAAEKALEYLPEEEAIILREFYGINGASKKTLEQLAKERGTTRETIRGKREAALRKLRHPDTLAEIRGTL